MGLEQPCEVVFSTGEIEPASMTFLDSKIVHVFLSGVFGSDYLGQVLTIRRKDGGVIGTFKLVGYSKAFGNDRSQFVCAPVSPNPAT